MLSIPRGPGRWLAAVLLVLFCGQAAAWTPYRGPPSAHEDQMAQPPAPYGLDRPYPQPGDPGMLPMQGPYYGMPGRYPPPGGYGFGETRGYGPDIGSDGVQAAPPGYQDMAPAAAAGSTTLEQHMTDDSYILDIGLDGLQPSQIKVATFGRALVIRTERSMETHREETFDDGRGMARSFSWSSGSSARRLPVPPDGDLGALQREDTAERVRIIIPRTGGSQSQTPKTQAPNE